MSSNWLGFSLTPHLKLGGEAGGSAPPAAAVVEEEKEDKGGVFSSHAHPLLPLSSEHYWRYDNGMTKGPDPNTDGCPKFEDFLGSCYPNPPANEPAGEINMNAPPGFTGDLPVESFSSPSLFLQPYDDYGGFQAPPGFSGGGAAAVSGLKGWPSTQDEKSAAEGDGHCDFQALSLTVSPDSRTAPPPPPVAAEVRKRGLAAKAGVVRENLPRKSIDTFGQRTSRYRGVTRHRWTGRYEAHLWDSSCRKEGQTRKGRQGGYDQEEKAARAYDLAALKYWGVTTHINFPLSNYEKELEEMKNMSRQEFVAHLRRKSSGFSRGASMYRGVTRHHQHGRWQARIGRVAGNKDLYLGTFSKCMLLCDCTLWLNTTFFFLFDLPFKHTEAKLHFLVLLI
ncbi:AP2-like ethylene-responsive transcription factor [Striga asiatica]|uniref:AP2-like ethylene-responsive transcription factor n=1 Tax=Striga asiatica TaxID=4170 RepID=A0A5A7R8E3_STRAF|nr:AP2-like ethylene-responsive transcription factor [Striga asiatica]